MAASKEDIRTWFERGVAMAATHLIVVTDTYDWEDYPVFVSPSDNLAEKISGASGNMNRVQEVYRLSYDMETQLNQARAYNL